MDTESYLVVLLADSNLPTGAFVASAGLESYIKHGFSSVTSFVQESLSTYARSALPFVSDAHRVVTSSDDHAFENETQDIQSKVLTELQRLDEMYESMTLNHVARRASKAQGVALLTLYARSFTPPAPTPTQKLYSKLVDRYKLAIRRGDTPGHLPVCWGVMTAALDLSLERTQSLHLFLHARSLLSAAVRLNVVGPYHAQSLLLHTVKPYVDSECSRCGHLRTSVNSGVGDESLDGPANTWPLGEILAGRHDLQHSRIFNS